MVAPGRCPRPLVSSRMPIPAVWKSVVDSTRSDRIGTSRLRAMRLPRPGRVKGAAVARAATRRVIGFLAIRAALNYSLGVRSIFLIRHGETLGNASRVVQHPDDPLSPRGLAQAER